MEVKGQDWKVIFNKALKCCNYSFIRPRFTEGIQSKMCSSGCLNYGWTHPYSLSLITKWALLPFVSLFYSHSTSIKLFNSYMGCQRERMIIDCSAEQWCVDVYRHDDPLQEFTTQSPPKPLSKIHSLWNVIPLRMSFIDKMFILNTVSDHVSKMVTIWKYINIC